VVAADGSDSPIPTSSKDPTRGDRDALVTLVVFSDFQCPFCGRLAPTLSALTAKYPSSDLRIVWKNNPLAMHKEARPAAEAGEGVFELGGNAAFWSFHDNVFANQSTMNHAAYESYAAANRVDVAKWNRALSAGAYANKVNEDVALATKLGISGVPQSYVNGKSIVGSQPLTEFTTLIDSELGKARARVAAGLTRANIYVTMSKENFAAPQAGSGGIGLGSPGVGTGADLGNGNGRLGGSRLVKTPTIRQGATTVNGSLPPEVIQRIVRQNFGRFRLCYENGLRANPSLQGRVTVKFVIDRAGSVSSAMDGGSDLPDQNVVQCVVRGFGSLSFPQPEGGIVTVAYPIIFNPGDP